LAEESKGQLELRRDAGSPAQSTLRGHLKVMERARTVERTRLDVFPGTVEYSITEPGRELLKVATALESWLADAPSGPLALGTDSARATIKGLVDGWLARMLTPLAEEPRSLTELDKRLSTISYPTIERRLETLRLTELIHTTERTDGGTPYVLSTWLRRGLAPLAIGAHWEHRSDQSAATPLTQSEIVSAFSIASPLLGIPSDLSGVCRVIVLMDRDRSDEENGNDHGLLRIHGGTAVPAGEASGERLDARASGAADAWFAAIVDGDIESLELSGDCELLATLCRSAHEALFSGVAP
jgi:DNA-binding HxlR family transcriptional regulator